MQAILLPDELVKKLHHIYELYDNDRHYVPNDEEKELEVEVAKEIAKELKDQEENYPFR